MQREISDERTSNNAERLRLSVIRAVAEHSDTEPMDLNPPVGEVVDVGALARLFPSRGAEEDPEGRVVFRYEDCRVAVDADGGIEVFDIAEPSSLP